MCSVRVFAVIIAAALTFCPEAARAQDAPGSREAQHFLFFAGSDLWHNGSFTHGGVLWAPNGLDQEGFVAKLVFGGGTYRYESGFLANAEVFGREFTASVLPGWRFRKDSFILTVFAGLDVQDHRLSPDDPSNKLRGTSAGFRGGFELWYEPNAGTMVSADVFSTMIGPSYSGHAAFGWRVFDRFYLGPEIQAFAYDNSYRQFRAGAHITAFKTETAEWSAGAGWARDSDHREGVYGRVGVLMRR